VKKPTKTATTFANRTMEQAFEPFLRDYALAAELCAACPLLGSAVSLHLQP
jgi:hypothetical protein